MFGGTKLFKFVGTSLRELGYEAIERNLEDYYHQLRANDYVPILGTEDVVFADGDDSIASWEMTIIGKECDRPWDVQGVTTEGAIQWFTTSKDTSSQSLMQSA